MELSEIERKIACGEMTAPQVFTQMKQHISESYLSIEASRDLDNINEVCGWLEQYGFKRSGELMPTDGEYDIAGERTLYIGIEGGGMVSTSGNSLLVYQGGFNVATASVNLKT